MGDPQLEGRISFLSGVQCVAVERSLLRRFETVESSGERGIVQSRNKGMLNLQLT